MAAPVSAKSSRSWKLFLLGLTSFAIGGFLIGVSFVVFAMGSSQGNTAAYLGFFFLLAGLLLALARSD